MKKLPIILSVLLLSSCSENVTKIEGKENVCQEKYKDKKLEVTGVLFIPSSFVTTGRMNMLLKIEGTDQKILASFSRGKENNKMEELPDNFSEKDIVIRDKIGGIITVADTVRAKGEMIATDSNWCQMNVDEIEKL